MMRSDDVGTALQLKEFDIEFEGLQVHCYEGGSGFPLLLLHGSGAGTSSTSNWALVLSDLAKRFHILAADLVGFGLSSRKSRQPYFDLDLWVRQAQLLFDRATEGAAGGIIGHSLSGFIALRLAAGSARVVKTVVTGCPASHFTVPRALDAAWSFPRTVQELKAMYEYVVATPTTLGEEFYAQRLKVLNAPGYAQYFSDMFAGDKQFYLDQLVLSPRELADIRSRVLFIHGAADRVVPFEAGTLPAMRSIATADALLLGDCGHGPALERPDAFLHAVEDFLL
jgi:2-hydroxymuconate-semialdehyde hydrolase